MNGIMRHPAVCPPWTHRPPSASNCWAAIPRLRRYAARSLVFDASAADDLVQTTLERALAHWRQFDQRRDILVWTLAIAHNAFIDERRRDKRPPAGSMPAVIDALPAVGNDLGLRMDLWPRCSARR